MVGMYHWLNGHEFEQTLGDSVGEPGIAEPDMIQWLNNHKKIKNFVGVSISNSQN